ncbi:hypothetical protein BU24DRAFT_481898 [Aaosphaeria arxii CBS 175.79]|uniref:D-isomer specific 2-hydroxyacid dehydrogenase NAD-binding domain-containing protein n=1 Tax=Aaosphaeria arxii CBS 175.79 TaxID=1450172 RepID=A0A6A5XNU8_9PLEO|nr:uncharacterized protein BU24DRAFT_481898 [Aaosphaeria arxii CBS 175.79]KAF2014441.1 hypothetical protein BU24DRAFT_481898 [Aaosphaeria arxii CBS 175.79]
MAPRELHTVLSTVAWEQPEIDVLRELCQPAEFIQCKADDKASIQNALKSANIAILASDIESYMLDAPRLAWIHCDHAGLNKSARPEVLENSFVVTSSAGRSAPVLAQHGFFFAMALAYDTRSLLERQTERAWEKGREDFRLRGALWGRKLGILGYGNTAQEMAKLGHAFGMHVTVLRRKKPKMERETPIDVDIMLSDEEGATVEALLDCDVIMIACSLTDRTHHLFGAKEFTRMKPSSVIINMGRGPIVDEEALLHALTTGQIAGAGLDVFEVEPLPKKSQLWDLPNVYITPHSTPGMPNRTGRSIEIISENIRRFKAGKPMLNELHRDDVYTKKS